MRSPPAAQQAYFNPRSPDGERLADPLARLAFRGISIHAPRMGSDRGQRRHRPHRPDFNPRSPDGERPRAPRCSTRTSRYFNPRSPDGERRLRHRNTMVTEKFQSTLPGWGATRGESNPVQSCRISIHAPRMGSDASVCRRWFDSWHFNPRSPDGERHGGTWACATRKTFQSTLPGWGATGISSLLRFTSIDFNPRSPDGERLSLTVVQSVGSIFQSTLPGWGATRAVVRAVPKVAISIHAPRMGSDLAPAIRLRVPAGISIHAPRMGSDYACWLSARFHPVFQSTLPGWGATVHVARVHLPQGISIHAPRMGSDNVRHLIKEPK